VTGLGQLVGSGPAFTVAGIAVDRYAATPTLLLDLRIDDPGSDPVHALALRAQVVLEPQRSVHSDAEAGRLLDVFGDRSRWSATLRPTTWTTCATVVPGLTGGTAVPLPLPVTYDLEIAVGRYLQALDDGEVPLRLLFSGTVFRLGGRGVWVQPVPWSAEATCRLPVAVWREAVDLHWPDSGWLRLRRDTLRALQEHRARIGATSFEETLADLLGERP
jgi:Family of unknown function (DUF6084)